MRDAVHLNQFEDLHRIDLAEANVNAGGGRNRPWEAPAVAVEHRQRPEIDRMLAQTSREDVAHCVEIRAAMMRDDAFGIARGAGRVTQRNRVPFVARQRPGVVRIAGRQHGLVLDLSDALAAGERGVVHVDDERFWAVHARQRVGHHGREFRIDQQDLCAAMLQHERDRAGIEPRVERVKNCAGHRHGEMSLIHRRDVRQHRRDRVATADALAREPRGKPAAAVVGLAPGEFALFVHDAGQARIDVRRALEKADWRQRHEVGRRLVEPDVVLADGFIHGVSSKQSWCRCSSYKRCAGGSPARAMDGIWRRRSGRPAGCRLNDWASVRP